ncbi:MAG TPA: hypothetical protein VIQ22_00090 [Gammaproteobacteria bacterium]|jgi:hypothetical protein
MAKILIRNRADYDWKPAIEAKLQVMLGSMLAHINRIDIEFSEIPGYRDGPATFVCRLEVTERNGESYLLYNYQPDANLAMEGAIARARRAITRLSRARVSNWGQVSAQQ